MKYMNAQKKYQSLNLQLFAGEGGAGDNGDNSGDDGDSDNPGDDPDGEGDEDPDEKKFSQKDIDDAVKKRVARERRG